MYRIVNIVMVIFVFALTALAQSGGVKGKVRSEQNEKSLPGVQITAQLEDETLKTTTTDSKGEFLITGLADGIYKLTFEKDGYSRSQIRFQVEKGKITDLSNRRLALPIDKGTMVVVQGSVFDEIGVSVPGARVEISRMTGGSVWEKIKAIYSSHNGEFQFRFPEGKATTYKITISYKGVPDQSKEKETEYAGIYRLSFTLPIKINKAREIRDEEN